MSSIQKRDSENKTPDNIVPRVAPELRKRDSENNTTVPELKRSKSSEPRSAFALHAVDCAADIIAAWGAGRFNLGDIDSALAEFFAKDCVIDASAAAHYGIAEYKQHHGFEGAKDWFDFVGRFDYDGTEFSYAAGPKLNEAWLRVTATRCTSKKTGKGAPFHCANLLTFEGGRCSKMTVVVYQPAIVAAILSEEDVPIPSMAQLPAFEPHPDPMGPYAEIMALWGAGELSKPEMMEKHCVAGALIDCADSALPDVFKAYEGITACCAWIEHIATTWELDNMDVAPVVGLKPGCVMHLFTADVKHKTTGKQADGVQVLVEFAFDADGKFVYNRHNWINAAHLASIY